MYMPEIDIVEDLNNDLANERMHMLFYLYQASSVVGLERAELAEFLREQAAGEMEHVEEFQNWIIDLGGKPTMKVSPYQVCAGDSTSILTYALTMEEEVVRNYAERIEQAEMIGGSTMKALSIFLEDQILDSQTDAQHIKKMLRK